MTHIRIFAECYAPQDIHNPFAATPCSELWRRWMEEFPRAQRLFLRIYHPNRTDDEESFLVPVGDPVVGGEEQNALYLPPWMIDSNRYDGAGETTVVEVLEGSAFPKATRIVLRPVDSALHEVDVIQVFEKCFSQLGVLQEKKLYLIPLAELGGYQTSVFVEKLEPEPEVYLDGDEVPLEFERAVDYVEPPRRPPTPIPAEAEQLVPETIADRQVVIGTDGMGGGNLSRPTHRPVKAAPTAATGYTPFSGQGYRLGGR